ncbi:MAG: flagellar motor switch protein FliN [Proteobacteria bacterium]|nr:flagellar motor switch protein FliN [Pseudomonadota bacterium]MBU1742618.1 flagellar motor switch protein FliN [Pseudomonadota bacterium]
MPEDEWEEETAGIAAAVGAPAPKEPPDPTAQQLGPSKVEAAVAGQNLDFILDIPLEISVELGRTSMLINDLLQLGQGSVVELNKLAGEPLEVLVNQKLVARGEVVVVNEKFGIRLTDIVSPIDRVKSLS